MSAPDGTPPSWLSLSLETLGAGGVLSTLVIGSGAWVWNRIRAGSSMAREAAGITAMRSVVAAQGDALEGLRHEMDNVRRDLVDCEKKHEGCETRLRATQADLVTAQRRIDSVEQRLRALGR